MLERVVESNNQGNGRLYSGIPETLDTYGRVRAGRYQALGYCDVRCKATLYTMLALFDIFTEQ